MEYTDNEDTLDELCQEQSVTFKTDQLYISGIKETDTSEVSFMGTFSIVPLPDESNQLF